MMKVAKKKESLLNIIIAVMVSFAKINSKTLQAPMPNIQKAEGLSLLELDSEAAPSCFVLNLLNLHIFRLQINYQFFTQRKPV